MNRQFLFIPLLVGLLGIAMGEEFHLRRQLKLLSASEQQDLVTIRVPGLIPDTVCRMPAVLVHGPYFYYHMKRHDANTIQPQTTLVEAILGFRLVNENINDPDKPGDCFRAFFQYYTSARADPNADLFPIIVVIDDSMFDTAAPTNAPTGAPRCTNMEYRYERYAPAGDIHPSSELNGDNPYMTFSARTALNPAEATRRQIQFRKHCDPVTEPLDAFSSKDGVVELDFTQHNEDGPATKKTVFAKLRTDFNEERFSIEYPLRASSNFVRDLIDNMQYSRNSVNVIVNGRCPGHRDNNHLDRYEYENCFPYNYRIERHYFGTGSAKEVIYFSCGKSDMDLKKARCVLGE